MAFTVPPLPYAFDALEPYIDKLTMEIHHDKHHGAYVTNLNKALESAPDLQRQDRGGAAREQLRHRAGEYPDRGAQQRRRPHQPLHVLADSGAQRGRQPLGQRRAGHQLARSAASITFKEKFDAAATGRFGSGWAWLIKSSKGVEIISTANQDSPVMEGHYPGDGPGRVGARLLSEVSEPPAGVHRGVVERGELAGDREAIQLGEVKSCHGWTRIRTDKKESVFIRVYPWHFTPYEKSHASTDIVL